MTLLLICTSYVGLHFAAYALAGRHLAALQTERGIFAYHALSYALALLAVAGTGITRTPGDTMILALLMASLHGIYSLSFLEIWSLTQGSYSLQLLHRIEQAGRAVLPSELVGAQAIGTQKQQERAGTLRKLGLIRPDGTLTVFGRAAALGLRSILWLSNGKPLN